MKKAFCDLCGKAATDPRKLRPQLIADAPGMERQKFPANEHTCGLTNSVTRKAQIDVGILYGKKNWANMGDEIDLCAGCALGLIDRLRERLQNEVELEKAKEEKA